MVVDIANVKAKCDLCDSFRLFLADRKPVNCVQTVAGFLIRNPHHHLFRIIKYLKHLLRQFPLHPKRLLVRKHIGIPIDHNPVPYQSSTMVQPEDHNVQKDVQRHRLILLPPMVSSPTNPQPPRKLDDRHRLWRPLHHPVLPTLEPPVPGLQMHHPGPDHLEYLPSGHPMTVLLRHLYPFLLIMPSSHTPQIVRTRRTAHRGCQNTQS